MIPTYQIAPARLQDIRYIPAIELAAVRLLEDYAPDSVQLEISREQDLRDAQTGGRLWVALSGDAPVGFAHVIILESGLAHLEELDVHPNHGRKGLGTKLVEEVFEWVKRRGYHALTLTTFREPPFNMPFYRKLGFAELPREDFTADLRTIVAHETNRGLDPEKRVVMIWRPI
jgi:GNAT superfamily N-acetyltransferase